MEIVTKIAPICLAIIMFGLGLGLTVQDFTRVVKNPRDFWNSIWKYFEVIGIKTNKFKLTKDLINSKFFVNSKLNFTI